MAEPEIRGKVTLVIEYTKEGFYTVHFNNDGLAFVQVRAGEGGPSQSMVINFVEYGPQIEPEEPVQ